MLLQDREWHARPGASREILNELRDAAPAELPDSYYALLAETNGGEGALPIDPFNLCLDTAEDVIHAFKNPSFDGFVAFGGNGGGELLAFDVRSSSPWSVVSIDMVAGAESAKQVAPSFDEFLKLIGRNED
jgi:hypothetical protein